MEKLKKRWEIQKNWQLLFPVLGIMLTVLAAFLIVRNSPKWFGVENSGYEWVILIAFCTMISFGLVRFFLWCFKKLENRWKVTYKWEMIAIFIVFAITGSLSGKLAGPLVELLGLGREMTHPVLYWTARIVLILPIYKIILVIVGWLFGQFRFFWEFEKKMLRRMGLGFLLP
ncbi:MULTISPECIES: DUF6787 family protein [Flagellimonas]|uniref:Prolipoprotein diacylglyceryl transferase n=1 Tax=Flagellimonas hadalis TaxID=2597517 RepID=A0A5N5ITX4_9FLAO|nr:DUF6787 family protein [Allomuricauda hadalis]KAB5491654.1 prolipoprotein diacylglyceryl transferase [Allomuricauda hadalis]